MNLNCKLLGFQPEAKFKLIEHTSTGAIFHYFAEFWDAEIFRGKSENKCEILEII
jgi:hypothetical protein